MRRAALTLALAITIAIGNLPAGADDARIGPAGVGDRFFPQSGNGGYDVSAYVLDLQWWSAPATLDGVATITATARYQLDRFNLDLRLPVRSVTVNGVAARFRRTGNELVVTPATPIASGAAFTTVVAYAGQPRPVIDPDGSAEGWMTWTGGTVALGEPQGSPAWYPANDHPRDKASFDISITVPARQVAVSIGDLVSTTTNAQRTT
jgi:aminopeptidase N